MYPLIERYVNRLTIDDVANFAKNKSINLNDNELNFTYSFVKKNWSSILKNPNIFQIDNYKEKYSEENFVKIKQVFNEYLKKYGNYL